MPLRIAPFRNVHTERNKREKGFIKSQSYTKPIRKKKKQKTNQMNKNKQYPK